MSIRSRTHRSVRRYKQHKGIIINDLLQSGTTTGLFEHFHFYTFLWLVAGVYDYDAAGFAVRRCINVNLRRQVESGDLVVLCKCNTKLAAYTLHALPCRGP